MVSTVDQSPVLRAQRWVLAVMALFPERRDVDGGFSTIVTRPLGSAQALAALAADGLVDADDVRRELVLLMAAARQSEPVYNLARASLIAARAHTAYLLPLDEAWTTAVACARSLQQHCRGWFSMAEACLTGLTTHQGEAIGRGAREAFYALHARPDSPWNVVPWKTELPAELPPPDVAVDRVHVHDSESLGQALAEARPGQTVVLAPARYVGPFRLATPGLHLEGGPDVILTHADDVSTAEPLLAVHGPTAITGLLLRPAANSTAIVAHGDLFVMDGCRVEGGGRGLVTHGFLKVKDSVFVGQDVALAPIDGAIALERVDVEGAGLALSLGAGVTTLRVDHGSALECRQTLACGSSQTSSTTPTPSIRLRSFRANTGNLDFRDDGRTTLWDCRLDGGVRVGGGEFLAERCQFGGASRIDYAIATFRDCHFLGASDDNLVLGEGHFTSIQGGQIGSVENPTCANVRVLGGTLRMEGVGLGPSHGQNLCVAPIRSAAAGHVVNARVELIDVVLSGAGREALVVRAEPGSDVRVKAKNLRIRGAISSGVLALGADLELTGLDICDVGASALVATRSRLRVIGFGLRGARAGVLLEAGSCFIARDVVATSVDGPLIRIHGARAAIAASDILLTGRVDGGAMLGVARALVPHSGLELDDAIVELDRCRLSVNALRLSASRVLLRKCEVAEGAITKDEPSVVAGDPTPSHSTAISPLLVPFKVEPLEAWGVEPTIDKLLNIARNLSKRMGYADRLGLRATSQGLRIDGPLPVVARFAPALSALLSEATSTGLALAEVLEPSE